MAAKRKKPTVDTPNIVYIEWVDAVADVGWEAATKAEIHPCYSIGYVIDETPEALCLALTWSHNQTNARMHIPKAWIKNRKVIKLENKQRKTKRPVVAAVDKRPYIEDISGTGA